MHHDRASEDLKRLVHDHYRDLLTASEVCIPKHHFPDATRFMLDRDEAGA